jgi:hypothetical protein
MGGRVGKDLQFTSEMGASPRLSSNQHTFHVVAIGHLDVDKAYVAQRLYCVHLFHNTIGALIRYVVQHPIL